MTDKIPLLVAGFFLSTILKSSDNVPLDTKHTLSVTVAFSERSMSFTDGAFFVSGQTGLLS